MPHHSERHMSQKRERTHMLNAKYGRHGHEGQSRHGHRGHANRPNPRQRTAQSAEDLASATIDHNGNSHHIGTYAAARDVLNDRFWRDDLVAHVGKTTWTRSPDGKRVKVSVINVKQAREYCDRMELKNILDEMDKREGMPTSADLAMQATTRPRQEAPQTQSDVTSRLDMRDVRDINEVPITPQELIGEQILHEESTSAAMESMSRHIADLHEAIDNQARERRRAASAKSDDAVDRATKAASMSGGKPGAGSTRTRQARHSRMPSGGGTRSGGGMRASSKDGNGKRGGGANREQLRRAKHQAFMRRRLDRIRKRIQRAKAVGNDRLATRLEAVLKRMTESTSKRQP